VDKDFWQKIRRIDWWIMLIISVIPFFGIQPIFFVLVFFMIDKRDEFQLIKYILSFKSSQFFGAGVIKGIIGFHLYYACVNFEGDDVTEHK
jgi:hypothetical protein